MSSPHPVPRRRHGIRARLLALALLPLVLVLPLLAGVLLVWGNDALDRLLITKVRSDLAVAQGYFERVQAEVGGGTRAAAGSHALVQPLQQGRLAGVPALLAAARAEHGLEFLNLLAPDGQLLARESGPVVDGPRMPRLVADASGALASVAVVEPARFAEIAPQLGARLGIALLPTQNATPSPRSHEDRALVLVARAPVLDEAGRLLGHLQGGVLLNRNLGFIDHLNQIVYPEGALPAGSLGTATLFLDDVRVSTNVRLFGGASGEPGDRAIGTRVSREVRDAVLGRGGTWLASAFVVNDWYVSAYEPLADSTGRRVGMLYVGFLERPFVRIKVAVLAGIGAVFFAVMALAAWVSLRWARAIFKPLERMTQAMGRVEAGDGAARVGTMAGPPDELSLLAGHLDHLLDTVDDKTRALQRWGDELDLKVAERTAELQATQARLLRSEKLATVGQLTASIAHEVNNPIAVIQGNLDLARELLGAAAAPAATELRLIDQQVERMRLIVTQLLQYARPGEYAGYVEPVDVRQVLQDCLLLLARQLQDGRVTLRQELHTERRAALNRQELQQVLINLIVNAQQAMPDGGLLTMTLGDWDDAEDGRPLGLRLRLQDSGPGVPAALRERLFQPFVTGRRDGTGLGLWISRSLVERYGGELRLVPSETGACFELLLRSETG